MTTTIEPAADVEAPDSAETGIETLGHANRFAVWDSEFRYDGRIRVPAGVNISKVEYAYYGRDDKSYVTATVAPRGQMGTSEQYEIIDLTFLEDSDVITFTLRGDLNVDAAPEQNQYSRTYRLGVRLSLNDGTTRITHVPVEVLWPHYNADKGYAGRPFVRLPYDTGWGGSPNSQAGFGYVSDNGYVAEKLIVDLVNPRQDVKDVASNYSDHVYWQLLHEDGTPSRLTPDPVKLNVKGHQGGGTGDKRILEAINLRDAGDKPGYYRFLVWPQSIDTASGKTSIFSWDRTNLEDAFQIGSIYYRYTATGATGARFSVVPGGPPDVKLSAGGPVGYPGVRLSTDDGPVPVHTVQVSLPTGMGLAFVAEGNPGYMLTVLDGDGAAKHYPGQLSADGQTLTFPKVNLALAGKTSQSIAFVAIRATDPDTTGRTSLTFQIGTETTQSTPIEVGAR
ncbi:hypothetical protein [Streptomyces pseudogriseolus]|uniref:hypothetical protein n=1 Tax=Streptomyces pseudogriseolus TaxID=36817 RepID=UPI003FA1DF9B